MCIIILNVIVSSCLWNAGDYYNVRESGILGRFTFATTKWRETRDTFVSLFIFFAQLTLWDMNKESRYVTCARLKKCNEDCVTFSQTDPIWLTKKEFRTVCTSLGYSPVDQGQPVFPSRNPEYLPRSAAIIEQRPRLSDVNWTCLVVLMFSAKLP